MASPYPPADGQTVVASTQWKAFCARFGIVVSSDATEIVVRIPVDPVAAMTVEQTAVARNRLPVTIENPPVF